MCAPPNLLPRRLPAPQVVPIYGRGGSSEDPRAKTKEVEDVVPQRPSGQRPPPVVRSPLVQQPAVAAQQQGLGIIPTLFGLQNAAGEGAPRPEPARAGQQWWAGGQVGAGVSRCRGGPGWAPPRPRADATANGPAAQAQAAMRSR